MTAGPGGVAAGEPGSLAGHRSKLRRDVEGLRAVAVLSVLVYHAGITLFPGGFIGVDIFFVISGFLITSLLIREANKTGRISLKDFYARRARRLLPAASVVLVFSALGTAWLFNGSEARDFGGDIAGAAANIVNWRFAARSIDYLAEDTGASPVLHFWSLAVEEQFYIVWPILAVVALLFALRIRRSFTFTMGVGLAVITVASFVWSLMLADSDPARGFFVTTTRIWELGIGAGVALAIPLLRKIPARIADWLAFFGLAAILISLIVSNQGMAWPGSAALLPVLGTAAVIAAGVGNADTWTARLLSIKPMVWIGGLSYSLYLWHWPLLVFAEQYRGYLGVKGGVIVSIGAIIPAYLSQRLIENPIRFSRKRLADRGRMLLLGALLVSVGVGSGIAVVAASPRTELGDVAEAGTVDQFLGARVLGENPLTSPAGFADAPVDTIYPAPADAPDDIPISYELGCQVTAGPSTPYYCPIGDPEGEIRILAVGDSKMNQYYEALDLIGQKYGWNIELASKSACPWNGAVPTYREEPYVACEKFSEAVLMDVVSDPPDVVLVTGGPFVIGDDGVSPTASMAAALETQWAAASDAGARVVVLLDHPKAPEGLSVFECAITANGSLEICAFDRAEGVEDSAGPAQLIAAAAVPSTGVVSVSDYVCPQSSCAAVIGNILVLRQGSHMTNSYALSLVDVLGSRLHDVIELGVDRAGVTFIEEQ